MKAKTKSPRSSRSLITTLALAFLAFSVIVLVISGGLQMLSNLSTQQDAVANELQIIAQSASQPVSSFITDKFSIMETAGRLVNLVTMAPGEQEQVLDSLLGRDQAFRQVEVLNAQDQEIANASRLSLSATSNLASQLSSDMLMQVHQGNRAISAVHIDPSTSEPLVLMAVPIFNALGDFQGTLAAEINLKFMWDLVDQIQVGDTGVAYVVDKQGNLLAFRDRTPVLRGDNVANLDEVREYITEVSIVPLLDLTNGIQGVPVIGAYALLGTPDWAVVAEMPWNEAYRGSIQNGIAAIVILVIMAALAGLLGVYVARRLSVPLVSLTNTASKISAGEIELQADVHGPSEVAQLATSFNSMTAQLRSLISELEDRVQARTEQLRASADVSRAATSILNPEQLLKQVADLITARFGFYYSGIFVLDEASQQAVLRAATGEAGRILLERGHQLPVDEQSMVGTAIIAGAPRIALDVGQEAVRFANPLLPNTRSEIALPLRVGDRNLGALDVQSEQAGAFDESSTEVLQSMADQIAVALFNAETFQRSERQTTVMALLSELSRRLATVTTLEEVAVITQSVVTKLLGRARLVVTQTTTNPQLLALREFLTDPQHPLSASASIPVTGTLIGECIRRGQTIYLADLSTVTDQFSDAADFYRQGVRCGVALPLRVGEHVLGTFNIGTDQMDAYSTEQVSQLEQIAAQLAITIENLNLAEQTQETLAELNLANRQLIGQAWEQYTRTTHLAAAEWRDGEWRLQDPRAAPQATTQALIPAASPLMLPIKVRGTVVGEIQITAADARPVWDEEDANFARSLVDQVGQVLETARLLDETERTARRERAVAGAADKIHRSTDVENVLQSAVTEIQRIMGRRGITVQLGFGRNASPDKRAPNGDMGGER